MFRADFLFRRNMLAQDETIIFAFVCFVFIDIITYVCFSGEYFVGKL